MTTTSNFFPSSRPQARAELSFGTGHLLTKEFARLIRREVQTIRKMLSQKGDVYGIRPRKVGKRWLWDVRDVASLLQGAEA
jgi:hypothetical protein